MAYTSIAQDQTQAQEKFIEIPQNIHFIWVGCPIPKEYLKSIMSVGRLVKRSPGFKLNLWVDNETNYYITLYEDLCFFQGDPQRIGINLRNINELKARMFGYNVLQDKFYKNSENNHYFFWRCVNSEMIGSKNFAAASDFLRIEILRQEGGVYFDTDIKFNTTAYFSRDYSCENTIRRYLFLKRTLTNPRPLDHHNPLCPQYSKFGFNVYGYSYDDYCFIKKQNFIHSYHNNSAIASTPEHKILEKFLCKIFSTYKKILNFYPSEMDFKRSYKQKRKNIWPLGRPDRIELTVQMSGIYQLLEVLQEFYEEYNDDFSPHASTKSIGIVPTDGFTTATLPTCLAQEFPPKKHTLSSLRNSELKPIMNYPSDFWFEILNGNLKKKEVSDRKFRVFGLYFVHRGDMTWLEQEKKNKYYDDDELFRIK